ncbi:hypothetical protein U0070_006228 [Myodes glareolus]|uniref:Uncharacterized protein n=1 Tax=Myodes glareolus TaxID=447135 RepID=A0AAW0I755_MYOGA
MQERGYLCEPAHWRFPLCVPAWRVRASLLRSQHQELPAPVLCHLPRLAAALPLHRLPFVCHPRQERPAALQWPLQREA